MSEYFSYTNLTPNSVARSTDVDSRFAQVSAGFDLLPSLASFELVLQAVVTAAGTANALTLSLSNTILAYTTGQRVTFKTIADNTSSVTLNIDGLGAKALKRADGNPLQSGDLLSGRIYDAVYDGTSFQLITVSTAVLDAYSDAASASASAAAASASGASTSAGTATTKAAEANASAIAAAASASAASTSASGAATSAATATTKAGDATSGAATATTKAGEAAASAVAADASADAAAASALAADASADAAAASAAAADASADAAAADAATIAGQIAASDWPLASEGTGYIQSNGTVYSFGTPAGAIPSLTGHALKSLRVKIDETGTEWVTSSVTVDNSSWSGTDLAVVNGGTGASDASGARSNLGLVIGTNVQAYDADLAAIAGLTSAADRVPYFTGAGAASLATFTSFGRSLVDDADAAAARSTLGVVIGTNVQAYDADLASIASLTGSVDRFLYATGASTWALGTITSAARALLDDNSHADMLVTLGIGIGTTVQAYDADLTAIAGLTSAADRLPYYTGAGTAALATFTAAARSLLDDASVSDMRTTLGLGIGTNVQAYDADLGALAGLATSGILVRGGSGIAYTRTLTAPAAGITISNGDGNAGNPTLALAHDLAALENLTSTGIAVRTGTNTWALRSVASGDGITVTNGDGVSGNPTVACTFASQAEAEAGVATDKPMNAVRVAQAIAAQAGGRTLISTTNVSGSGSTLDLTSIPSSYTDLRVVIDDVIITSGSLQLYLGVGGAYTGFLSQLSPTPANKICGVWEVLEYNEDGPISFGSWLGNNTSPNSGAGLTGHHLRLTGGLDCVRFNITDSGTFSSGQIRLYGRA